MWGLKHVFAFMLIQNKGTPLATSAQNQSEEARSHRSVRPFAIPVFRLAISAALRFPKRASNKLQADKISFSCLKGIHVLYYVVGLRLMLI